MSYHCLVTRGTGNPIAAAFLSHAIEDAEVAKAIKVGLEAQRISVFMFESDLAYGHSIWETVRRKIETSDYFLVVLSRSALSSEAVAREIGLALELRSTRATPIVIGVISRELSAMRIQLRQFDDGTLQPKHLDFGELRSFSEWHDGTALIEFGRSLQPCVRFVTTTNDTSSRELFLRSEPCLLQLFPELCPTDYVKRIWAWLEECEAPGSRWEDVFGVMELDQQPVGILYTSVPKEGRFAFGNYFGIVDGSRHLDRARLLVENCRPRVHEVNPVVRGIVFEAEVPDLSFLEGIAANPEKQRLYEVADQARLKRSLRALARLAIYQRYGARTLIDAKGQLLPIPTPSQRGSFLDDPLSAHLLMYYPWESDDAGFSTADLDSLFHFVYDELYGDAYGDGSEMGFPGYREYVARLRSKYVEKIRGLATIGRAKLSRDLKLLLVEADLKGPGVDL